MIGLIILKLILMPALAPLCVGLINKWKAILMNRWGAPIIQPYRDIWKLFHKDEVISRDSSWIFQFAPFLSFGVSILVPLALPLLTTSENVTAFSHPLVVVYTLGLSAFFMALASIDTGSMFGGFGASREVMLSALAEATVIMSVLPAAMLGGSADISHIVANIDKLPISHFAPIVIAIIAFFIALLGDTSRIPFDNPTTQQELTMIHHAMSIEYSGKRRALLEWAGANKLLFVMVLGINLFTPWGIVTGPVTFSALLLAAVAIAAKVVLVLAAITFIEVRIARLRFFKLPNLILTSFVLTAIGILMVGI